MGNRNDRGGSNSLDGEIGNNGLTEGDAAIITGYLLMGKNPETAAFQQADRFSQQQAILEYAAT